MTFCKRSGIHELLTILAFFSFFGSFGTPNSPLEIKISNQTFSQLYDPELSLVHFISPDSLFTVDLKSFKLKSVIPLIMKDLDIKSIRPILIKGEMFFIEFTGGRVFKFGEKGLIRIDKSYNHRMQSYSSIFIYDDTIYRYGGYGFWGVRKIITKYSFDTQEWEKLKIKSQSEPIGRYDPFTFIKGDDLYVIGGTGLGVDDQPYALKDTWKFNFKSSEWKDLGTINFPEFIFDSFQSSNNFFGSLAIYDFKNRNFYSLDTATLLLKTFEKDHYFQKIIKGFMPFSIDSDTIISVINYGEHFFLRKLLANDVLPESNNLHPLLSQSPQFIKYLYFSLISLLIIITYFFLDKRNNIVMIYPTRLRKGLRSISISNKEYLLMKSLSENLNNLEVKTALLIIGEEHFNNSHNFRLKTEMIRGLNDKLGILIKSGQPLIMEKKNEYDKRFKYYFWNHEKISLKV